MRAVRFRFLPTMLLALAFTALSGGDARAEIRGRSFQIGGIVGVVPWSDKVGLEPCGWFGATVGHRFAPLAERLHLGFHAGWEGCVAEQTFTGDRIDFILVDFGFTYGVRATEFLFPYGIAGAGFAVIDATPSGGGPHPRTVFVTGGGVELSIGPYFMIDLSIRLLIFENVQLGGFGGEAGSAFNPLFSIAIGAQI
jgi:hypothetical protein